MTSRPVQSQNAQISYATVSRAMLEDLLTALRRVCDADLYDELLRAAALDPISPSGRGRVSRDQIVRLYQQAARRTGDEMMGLWSRPIRAGALKHIGTSALEASSLGAGIFRMVTFWNLVLDDYRLVLKTDQDQVSLQIIPIGVQPVNRFGHMLLLKLTHGLASWLAGQELPVKHVSFVFSKPDFSEDYAVLFPAKISFGASQSSISFDRRLWALPIRRRQADLRDFLQRAPQDWIFTTSNTHALALRVRELIFKSGFETTLADIAEVLNLTPRTLIRHLKAQGTAFQTIKDNLRRDIAMKSLMEGKPISVIAEDIGLSSPATFHRAFKHWTGTTAGDFRRALSAG